MSRLTAGFWVQAYMMRLSLEAIPAYVLRRGDETAGAVWVKVATLDGQAELWERRYDLIRDVREWRLAEQAPEADIDARIARETGRDQDLWVIEVEDPRARHLLDDPSLA